MFLIKHAVGGRPPRYAPAPLRAARCDPAPAHTRLACGAQRALPPVAVGAMNIHDAREILTLRHNAPLQQTEKLEQRCTVTTVLLTNNAKTLLTRMALSIELMPPPRPLMSLNCVKVHPYTRPLLTRASEAGGMQGI